MKKRVGKKILSAVLAASMILGNIALPQGLGEVHAAQVDIGSIISGKTQVTDSEIENLYRKMSYTPQGVHDPSIIKIGDEWYVFGSHRAVAKTSDLQNWQTVNIDGLFGDGEGKVLTPDEAFVNSLYQGTIQTSDAAKALMRNKEEEETEETDQVTVESEETSESETESETVSESETEFESETEQPSESEPASKTEQETEQPSESEPASKTEQDPEQPSERDTESKTEHEPEPQT
ncbi:MAG: hypothetical protein K2O40_05785, partial [Lachnospiraceae bacterium]|nr:hypothetical protein [Lachnospiraceae bacterium]